MFPDAPKRAMTVRFWAVWLIMHPNFLTAELVKKVLYRRQFCRLHLTIIDSCEVINM